MDSKRFTAFFIDFLITAMINNIPFMILIILPSMQRGRPMAPQDTVIRAFLSSLLGMLYRVFRYLPSCGSIGKMAMKLKIVDAETGEPVSAGRRILRNIPWLLNWIEILTFVFTKKRIGDRIARTDVVAK